MKFLNGEYRIPRINLQKSNILKGRLFYLQDSSGLSPLQGERFLSIPTHRNQPETALLYPNQHALGPKTATGFPSHFSQIFQREILKQKLDDYKMLVGNFGWDSTLNFWDTPKKTSYATRWFWEASNLETRYLNPPFPPASVGRSRLLMLKKPRNLLNLRRQEAGLINVLADWRWFMNPYSNEALCTKSTMPWVFFATKKYVLTMCHLSKSYLKSGTFSPFMATKENQKERPYWLVRLT